MNPSPAIELLGISKRYPHFHLDRIDMTVPTGCVMGFLGANGAGKSTTIRIMLGLVTQDSGQANVLGHAMPCQQALAKLDIGFVSEDLRLYPDADLAWHMDWMASIYPAWDQVYAMALAQKLYLNPAQPMRQQSHGQRVKAALLLALARRPRLLILDEPTTGLDPVARHEVLAALMEVVTDEERTVLFSSQNTRDVEQIADRLTFIDQGRIVDSDDTAHYTERWRRLRLDVPGDVALPELPGTVEVAGQGRARTLTTSRFEPALAAACEAAGAAVRSIEPMNLEEIFVCNVLAKRKEQAK
jgi:ABC-2 type transport system ATP-binding protein